MQIEGLLNGTKLSCDFGIEGVDVIHYEPLSSRIATVLREVEVAEFKARVAGQ